MSKGIEKIVGSKQEFDTMVKDMGNAILPVCLQHKDPIEAGITLEDMREFSIEFKKASGLDLEFTLGTCDHCNRLHMFMIVKDKEEET